MSKARLHATLSSEGNDIPARMSYAEHERDAVHAEKRRLAARASYGRDWDGKAENDNINWPVGKALLAEGNTELLKYAMRYRQIYDMAKSEVAIGFRGTPSPEMRLVHKNQMDESTGKIRYSGELVLRRSSPNEIPATRSTPTNADSKKNAAPVPKPWNGDMEIINAIDARVLLGRMQARLGPIQEPFEMAVVDCATLEQVGNAAGIANRAGAMGAGRALVHVGLLAVCEMLGGISRKDMAA